jgi:hypothetical protein
MLKLPSAPSNSKVTSQQGLGCGRAETHDKLRMYRLYLGLEPWTASAHFLQTRLLMQTALAAKFPLEVLDCICNVNRTALDSCLFHASTEEFSRRSNKWLSRLVFLVSRLFADEQDRGARRTLSKYGLSCFTEKVASAAILGGSPQRDKIPALRQEEQCGGCRSRYSHARFDAPFPSEDTLSRGLLGSCFIDTDLYQGLYLRLQLLPGAGKLNGRAHHLREHGGFRFLSAAV